MANEAKEVYERLNTLEREVTSIGTQLTSISRAVEQLVDRQAQPTNWIGLGSLLIALTVAFGTYLHTRLEPVSQEILTLEKGIVAVEDRTQDRMDLRFDDHQRQLNDLKERIKE